MEKGIRVCRILELNKWVIMQGYLKPRETDRQIDKYTDRQKDGQTDRQTDRQTKRQRDEDNQTKRQRDEDSQTKRQRDEDRQTERSSDNAPSILGLSVRLNMSLRLKREILLWFKLALPIPSSNCSSSSGR